MDRADLLRDSEVVQPIAGSASSLLERDIDAGRDAIAAVLAIMRGDGEGFVAVLNGTDRARMAFGVLACITAGLLVRSGITEPAARQILTEARRSVDDALIDALAASGWGCARG